MHVVFFHKLFYKFPTMFSHIYFVIIFIAFFVFSFFSQVAFFVVVALKFIFGVVPVDKVSFMCLHYSRPDPKRCEFYLSQLGNPLFSDQLIPARRSCESFFFIPLFDVRITKTKRMQQINQCQSYAQTSEVNL